MIDWVALSPHSITDYGGEPTIVAMYTQVFTKASAYAVLFVAIWAAFVVLLRAAGFGEVICGARRGTWALKAMMLTHHALVASLAVAGLADDPTVRDMYSCFGCREAALRMNRAADAAPLAARALTPVTLGYFVADLLLLSQWNLNKSGATENMLMLFHHFASLTVWPAAIYFDWVARYVLIMLSYEFTGVWLTALWMLSTANMKKSPIYMVVGLLFTSSFVIMRMVGAIPQLVAMFAAPPWSAELQAAAQPGGIHHLAPTFCMSLVFPHLLNLFWGVKVVSGFAAVLFGKSDKKKGEADGKKAA